MANRRNLIGKVAVMLNDAEEVIPGSYTVNLNSNWQNSSINPDSIVFNSYESYSNKGTGSSDATMYIYIRNYSSFKMYIRSYAESNYDYVMVSQLDKTINGTSSYNDTTLVKAHTRGNQQSGTALSNYTLVEFTGITPGDHTITVVYRKDGSVDENDDKGYVLIAKDASNAGSDSGSGDDGGGSNEGPFDINNYLTIVALEDGLTASLSINACEYCIDGDGNWKSLSAGNNTPSINKDQTLSFRGNLTTNSGDGIGTFTISKSCNLEGNCMSMLFGDNAANNRSLSGKNYAFYELFYNCTTIKSVSSGFLPATTLSYSCYKYMFYRCTSLTTAPELPATTLAESCYNAMFYRCTSLTTAPELPATTLTDYCYYYMFCGCSKLTTAPSILPAMTLTKQCYYDMFNGCNKLTQAPELPATTLAEGCYYNMFGGCASLTQAPALPATTLVKECYYMMFDGCKGITQAPELPATTLASNCYYCMFQNCIGLTIAPELPATTLAEGCYSYMFNLCTNLTTVPELPATTLVSYCYQKMFQGCSKLNYIKAMFTTTPSSSTTDNWVNGVASIGTFVKNSKATWNVRGLNGVPEGWSIRTELDGSGEPIIDINNYLTIVALEDGLTAKLIGNACEYCIDGDGNWKSLSAATNTRVINAGQTLSFRGNLIPNSSNGIGTFVISKSCNLEGNCMSMLFGDDVVNNLSLSDKSYSFYKLFQDCTTIKIVSADFLPATTLSDNCYSYMFSGCANLIQAPKLSATTLVDGCYNYMFHTCSELNCIKAMFITEPSTSYTDNWVNGVASIGTFVKNPDATWNVTGVNGIPEGWVVVNDEPIIDVNNYLTIVSLEHALTAKLSINACEYCIDGDGNWRTLPADTNTASINKGQTLSFRGNLIPNSSNGIGTFTISNYCNIIGNCMSMLFGDNAASNKSLSGKSYAFRYLFNNCTPIKNVSSGFLSATTLAEGCYSYMFANCIGITQAPELPATTLANYCYQRMFQDCTSLIQAPELSAMTLGSGCYNYMFQNCSSLTTAPDLPATKLAGDCYYGIFYDCVNLTITPELPATTLSVYCYSYMFKGCSKVNYIKAMFTTTPSNTYTPGWVDGVASIGRFVKNSKATWNVRGINGIPSGWSVQTATQ